jgi:crotonobetaine/carnitine-CoA ligase
MARPVTLPELIDARAESEQDRTAVTIAGESISFAGLAERSIAVANGLSKLGLAHGQPLALLMNNSLDGVLGWFGASRLGAVDVPVNTAYAGDFLRRTLANTASDIVLADNAYVDVLVPVARAAGVKQVVVRDPDVGALAKLREAGLLAHDWATALADNGTSSLAAARPLTGSDQSSVIYTSGTTGASKGVTFSHGYLLGASERMLGLYEFGRDDVYYGSMPLFHLAAKACGVVAALLTGGSCVLDSKFSVSRTWNRVRESNATIVHLLGSMMVMLNKLPPAPDDAELPMRAVFSAPVPATIHREFEQRYNCRVVTCYALSEATPITRGGLHDQYPLNSAGRVNGDVFDLRLVDEQDNDVPEQAIGEILVRPKINFAMFSGYWHNPEATLDVLGNLWFHTGDLGRIDEDGWFYYEGRRKDALRRRGENVSAAELEMAVREHPAVNDVAAVGVPSDVMEDDIMVFVELTPGSSASYADLHAFCAGRLPFFMVPRYIEIVDALPRNPIAKIEKYKLKARGTSPATWDAAIPGLMTPPADPA